MVWTSDFFVHLLKMFAHAGMGFIGNRLTFPDRVSINFRGIKVCTFRPNDTAMFFVWLDRYPITGVSPNGSALPIKVATVARFVENAAHYSHCTTTVGTFLCSQDPDIGTDFIVVECMDTNLIRPIFELLCCTCSVSFFHRLS